jgi:fructoselysine 6-kinase
MIISVGDASIDHYVTTGEKYAGGIAANFAVHVRRMGEPIMLIAALGDDQNGDIFLRQMQHESVDTSHVQRLHGGTARQNIRLVGKHWDFCGYYSGVFADFHLTKEDFAVLQNADAVVAPLTDGLKNVFEEVILTPLEKPIKIADFSRHADIPGFSHGDVVSMLMHYLEYLDVVFIGGDESLAETIQSIAESNPEKIIILTMGPKGVQTFHKGKVYTKAAKWVRNMVDTTGCGDAFRAGFVVTYMQIHDIPKALDVGTDLAAQNATHMGGF